MIYITFVFFADLYSFQRLAGPIRPAVAAFHQRFAQLQRQPLAMHALVGAVGRVHLAQRAVGAGEAAPVVAEHAGVAYYDDSKATTVVATQAALDGIERPAVLIAGGDGKGQDFAPLAEPASRYVRSVLLIGRDAPKLREALEPSGVELVDCRSLPEAVQRAADVPQAPILLGRGPERILAAGGARRARHPAR